MVSWWWSTVPSNLTRVAAKRSRAAHRCARSGRTLIARSAGAVTASIWRNEGKSGAFHNVTLSRRHKEGEDWKDTSSLGKFDLLKATGLFIQAYSWIEYYEQHGTEEPEKVE